MLMAEYDYQMDIEVQREEAEEIGEQRGIQIEKQESIRKLYQKNWSIADIAEFVEMSEEQVREIMAAQR